MNDLKLCSSSRLDAIEKEYNEGYDCCPIISIHTHTWGLSAVLLPMVVHCSRWYDDARFLLVCVGGCASRADQTIMLLSHRA